MIYASAAVITFLALTLFMSVVLYCKERKQARTALLEALNISIYVSTIVMFAICLTVDWAEILKPGIIQ